MKRVLIMLVGGLLLIACGVVGWGKTTGNPVINQRGGWFGSRNFASNGERIYFTATNDNGQRIPYTGGPNFGGMMMGSGTNLACDSCHGSDGRGGFHTMHMDVMDAPDIRFVTLSNEADEHGDDEHGDEHGEYDLEAFRRAVVDGKHPDGDALSREMPRWRMDDKDLADLFMFLESLP
jgi:hypothetical protein